ncbi:hypothetical protein LACPH_001063 [Lacticaseibacillus parahuelsenbergensis]|uniref:Uncharacterized protein n=1 Tax=Lacticaseibacillus parahuelsenbergensis TaxID=3068305 RepID=A0ABY9L5L9_9LACO|nr:hypothetical protein [Lacticaseibacillus sp. NCIMB 15471]WLV79032.1 hypothetical protein LACPH_001063 [Lacticaseibacillus sp. NCIMB 15471]
MALYRTQTILQETLEKSTVFGQYKTILSTASDIVLSKQLAKVSQKL